MGLVLCCPKFSAAHLTGLVSVCGGLSVVQAILVGCLCDAVRPQGQRGWAASASWCCLLCCVSQGLTEEQAVKQYGDVDIYTSSFRPMRNTISGSPLRTFMKLVVDAASDKVVGCHMVGDDSAEIMQVCWLWTIFLGKGRRRQGTLAAIKISTGLCRGYLASCGGSSMKALRVFYAAFVHVANDTGNQRQRWQHCSTQPHVPID